jgi:hypothetical protein
MGTIFMPNTPLAFHSSITARITSADTEGSTGQRVRQNGDFEFFLACTARQRIKAEQPKRTLTNLKVRIMFSPLLITEIETGTIDPGVLPRSLNRGIEHQV